jgi:hypothetical protein
MTKVLIGGKTAKEGSSHLERQLTEFPFKREDGSQRFLLAGKTAGRGSFYLERQLAEVPFTWEDS